MNLKRFFKSRSKPDPNQCECGAGLSAHRMLSGHQSASGVKFLRCCTQCGRHATLSGSDMRHRAAYLQLINQPTRVYTSSARWVF